MKILDVLRKETIITDLKSQNKKGVIEELAASVSQITGTSSRELVQVLLERERLGSTGIGGGIGIPHGKLANLESLIMGFGLSRIGVDFESMDGRPTHLFPSYHTRKFNWSSFEVSITDFKDSEK